MRKMLMLPLWTLALALVAGGSVSSPVHAQSYEEDYRYSSRSEHVYGARPAAVDDDELNGDDLDDDPAVNGDDDDGPGDDLAGVEDGEGRCAAQFRSFDPISGTYSTLDGDRERCPYLD